MIRHATRVHIEGRRALVTCSCGYRGPLRRAIAGSHSLRRLVIADELHHHRAVAP